MVYKNLNEIELVEEAIINGEGKLGKGGSLIVFTGDKTGRSPKDKHVVREENTADKLSSNKTKDNFGKISRNQQCPCGSGKKFKHCCGKI